MAESNGEKSKLIAVLFGILQTIILGWCWWVGSAVVEAKTHIATLEANYGNIEKELIEIKGILLRKPR